jgi:hypothetical protein
MIALVRAVLFVCALAFHCMLLCFHFEEVMIFLDVFVSSSFFAVMKLPRLQRSL